MLKNISYLKILITALFCGLIGNSFGQSDNNEFGSKNSIYIEFIGEATPPFSIHYDRVIQNYNSFFLSINTGFGYFPSKEGFKESLIGIPISLSCNIGKNKNYLEIACGFTYNSGFIQKTEMLNNEGSSTTIKSSILGSLRLGYRYQKPDGGFFFKLGLTPIFELIELNGKDLDYSSYLPFGIGLGFSF